MDIMKTPRLGQWILRVVLPEDLRDAVMGDLEEGFGTAKSPRLWFWRQVAASLPPAILMGWRRPAVLRIGASIVAAHACCVALTAAVAWLFRPLLKGTDESYAVMTLASVVMGVVGSTVVALVVPMAPRRAGRILAGLLVVMAAISASPDFGRVPAWYSILLVAAGPLGAWWGARNAPPSRQTTAR